MIEIYRTITLPSGILAAKTTGSFIVDATSSGTHPGYSVTVEAVREEIKAASVNFDFISPDIFGYEPRLWHHGVRVIGISSSFVVNMTKMQTFGKGFSPWWIQSSSGHVLPLLQNVIQRNEKNKFADLNILGLAFIFRAAQIPFDLLSMDHGVKANINWIKRFAPTVNHEYYLV